MDRISNILVIVDPTTAEVQPAIGKAALLAERCNARLELFACDTKASQEARFAADAERLPGAPVMIDLKVLLEALAKPVRARGLEVTTEATAGDPLHAALLERIKQSTADLVVKDTHHHSLAQRVFLTNTDWHLIRECPVSLLLTKPAPWSSALRVLAAVDPSHVNDKPAALDRRILDQAATFAQKFGGELHAVHAYLPMSIVATTTAMPPMVAGITPEELERDRAAKLKQVGAVTADYHLAPEQIHLEIGGPATVLPRVAADVKADLVAMGAISRSGLKRVFVGSTAESVLERLPCDALIVKPPNFLELLPF